MWLETPTSGGEESFGSIGGNGLIADRFGQPQHREVEFVLVRQSCVGLTGGLFGHDGTKRPTPLLRMQHDLPPAVDRPIGEPLVAKSAANAVGLGLPLEQRLGDVIVGHHPIGGNQEARPQRMPVTLDAADPRLRGGELARQTSTSSIGSRALTVRSRLPAEPDASPATSVPWSWTTTSGCRPYFW